MLKFKLRRKMINSLPIETERLIIRYLTPDDAYDMFEYSSLPEVTEFLLWSPHLNIEATEGYLESLQKRYIRGLYGDWGIELKENGKMIGTCGYASFDSYALTCEIGYVLSPKYRKKGYMTEAVEAILALSFETLELESAQLRIITENSASIALANRLGFQKDYCITMEIKGVPREVSHFVITQQQYFDKKRSG